MYEMTVEKQRQTWYNKILSTTASVKTEAMLVSDITNNIVCRRISAIICTYMIYLKCQRFLDARQGRDAAREGSAHKTSEPQFL